MGTASAVLGAAAFGRKILSRTWGESRGAVPALRIGRLPLFNRAAIAWRRWTGRADFVRQPSGLGRASAEMGMRRLGQSRLGTCVRATRERLGLRKF